MGNAHMVNKTLADAAAYHGGVQGATFTGVIKTTPGTAAAAADAVVLGGGTTANPVASSTANAKFIELRCSSTVAGASDARGIYVRFALDGAHASAGGESVRGLTMVNQNIGTAHGAHFGLGFVATAGGSECSGLGAATRATLHIPNVASWAPTGTYAALQAEIYSDGANSDPAGMTKLSFIRVENAGNATGMADVDDDAFLMEIKGCTKGAGHTVGANTAGAGTLTFTNWLLLKIDIDGTTHYIPCAQTVAATA